MGKAKRALHRAAEKGNVDAVELLLDVGVDVDARDKDGWAALHHAVYYEQLETINLLLEKGADINSKDKEGWTALHIATYYDQTEMVNLLLANDADLHAENDQGETALFLAKQMGSGEIAKLLLECGYINSTDKNGWTPLHHSVYNDKINEMKLLLNEEIDINATDSEGETALHHAAYYGQTEAVKLLLESNADPSIKADNGMTAFFYSVQEGQAGAVELLLDYGVDVNASDEDGWKALHYAAYYGQTETAELLIGNGADPGARDEEGRTALFFAEQEEQTETVELLIQGSDINAKDGSGRTVNQKQEQIRDRAPKTNLTFARTKTSEDLLYRDFVAIDVETTGMGNADKIIDLAAIRFRSGEEVDKFSKLVNPGMSIPFNATRVHGIADRDVFMAPRIDDIFHDFIEFISDDILVAHNAPFDMRFLNQTAQNLCGDKINNEVLCTLRLARKLVTDIDNHKLETLVRYFEIPLDYAHRAYPDALATGQLYRKLMLKLQLSKSIC